MWIKCRHIKKKRKHNLVNEKEIRKFVLSDALNAADIASTQK